MLSIRPLVYLFWRQIVNGVKRAVSTPRRLISILVGIGYYVGFFMRPWDRKSSSSIEKSLVPNLHIDATIVQNVGFLVFTIISIFLAMGIFGFKNTFKQADVDVLFPTPISTKVVMMFRLFRDYLATLLFPFIIIIFTYQPTLGLFNAMKKSNPGGLSNVLQGGMIAWILLAFCWISISYAMSFHVAKNEKKSRLIVQGTGWILFLGIMSVIGFISLRMNQDPSAETLWAATSAWWVRGIMILPYAASSVVGGVFDGSPLPVLGGLGFLSLVIVGCLAYAANLSGWMYDQAATKGFQSQALREYQKKSDFSSIAAERARQGKIKRGRLAKKVANWNFRGGWTLIYKEILIQSRIGFWQNLFFILVISAMGTMFLTIPNSGKRQSFGTIFYLGMTGFMAINMSSIQAFSGFVETLRRVEVMKPLPLTSRQIAFFETTSKAVVAMVMAFAPFVVGFIYRPMHWQYHVAGMIAAPMGALALVAAIFVVVVLFPDFDDPTQRSFRGLMQLLALVVVLVPTFGVFAACIALGISPIIPALITAGINFGVTVLLTSVAGRFYADFNPSE